MAHVSLPLTLWTVPSSIGRTCATSSLAFGSRPLSRAYLAKEDLMSLPSCWAVSRSDRYVVLPTGRAATTNPTGQHPPPEICSPPKRTRVPEPQTLAVGRVGPPCGRGR
jgi:hypothetical protein